VLATYATTRTLAPTQRIFGCFTNLMGMRLRLEGDPSVREWLSEVRRAVTDASAQSQIPAEELCEDLRPPGRRRRTSRRS
jgi:non-ribosomal peptide synthetase component F